MANTSSGIPARPVRVISVSSGKGGVGKTTVAINLAAGLGLAGHSVVLFDADVGLANVDVLLGLSPRHNLGDVIAGERTLRDILVPGPAGVQVVPGASGLRHLATMSVGGIGGLVYAFSELGATTDCMIVDAPAGIDDAAIGFCAAAQENVIVVCNDPASITDAYATIKNLHQESRQQRFRVVANMVASESEARFLFKRLVNVTDRFLDVTLDLVAVIPNDPRVREAAQRRRALLEVFPSSPAALEFKKLAQRSDTWPVPATARGSLEYFVEHLLQGDAKQQEEQVSV